MWWELGSFLSLAPLTSWLFIPLPTRGPALLSGPRSLTLWGGGSHLLCGDFNAHSPLWGSRFSNFQGRELCSVVLDRGLVP